MTVEEPGPDGLSPVPTGELAYRLRQQRVLADFGMEALRSHALDSMLQRATELCASGMQTQYCKFLEYLPEEDGLLVRAGVGWRPGIVGVVRIGADLGSPAGFAYKTGEAVISNHLQDETRFRTPKFMAEHEVRRAINVLVEADGARLGVLEVDSPIEGEFAAADLAFMQGFANLIGVAIERQRAEARLTEAVAHQELLTREASHRVKNSLTMVSAMLNLQMQQEDDPRVAQLLGDAQARIATIAQAHDQLWRGKKVGLVALDGLVCGLARSLEEQAPRHRIACDAEHMTISADTAIPIGLLVTELVTNAIKYAYPDGGPISVRSKLIEGKLIVEVSDEGQGLPADFSVNAPSRKSLGVRMVLSLARQLGGTVCYSDGQPGTVARLIMDDPRDPADQ